MCTCVKREGGGRDVYMCEEGGWREVGGGGSRVPGSLTW